MPTEDTEHTEKLTLALIWKLTGQARTRLAPRVSEFLTTDFTDDHGWFHALRSVIRGIRIYPCNPWVRE